MKKPSLNTLVFVLAVVVLACSIVFNAKTVLESKADSQSVDVTLWTNMQSQVASEQVSINALIASSSLPFSFNNIPAHALATSTGAVGFQISATRDSFVSASVGVITTASIGSGQDAYIAMEVAPTNSASAGDWVEIGRVRNGQTYSIAVALQGIQTIAGDIARVVPAGYYVKYRVVNLTGTPVSSWVSGQEVQL